MSSGGSATGGTEHASAPVRTPSVLDLVGNTPIVRIRALAVPSEWSDSKPEYRRHAPRLGEHTHEVLREAGLSDHEIHSLIDSGAAKQAPL